VKEVYGSIWVHFLVANHFVCITTNGTVKKNGDAVMGRGNAKQATICIPKIKPLLGRYLKERGNVAGYLDVLRDTELVIFPVKHNWWEKADIVLIEESTEWLKHEAHRNPKHTYHLPRPGCGNGKLKWEFVKPRIQRHLPDNVLVHYIDNVEMNTGE
jgi:hypothetical protein